MTDEPVILTISVAPLARGGDRIKFRTPDGEIRTADGDLLKGIPIVPGSRLLQVCRTTIAEGATIEIGPARIDPQAAA